MGIVSIKVDWFTIKAVRHHFLGHVSHGPRVPDICSVPQTFSDDLGHSVVQKHPFF